MIGIFDSGYGGLSIFREIRHLLPQYDYIYLGDNARAPYGDLSFETVNDYTRQAVDYLFAQGCPLVILACNTASAKALRNIQMKVLPYMEDPTRRVLGVIRPTVERVAEFTYSGHVGVIATRATVSSQSYEMEIEKLTTPLRLDFKPLNVSSLACPSWVPLIEEGKTWSADLHKVVYNDLKALLEKDPEIDTIILGCTHYPLITSTIQTALQELEHPEITLIPQGKPVAYSLRDYLKRHPEMDVRLSKNGTVSYQTTGNTDDFNRLGSTFMGTSEAINATQIILK